MSSVKLLQYSAAGKEEKCNKFKFFASYHYIPISLITVQLLQILNLTLSSFLGEKRVTTWEIHTRLTCPDFQNLNVKNNSITNPQSIQKQKAQNLCKPGIWISWGSGDKVRRKRSSACALRTHRSWQMNTILLNVLILGTQAVGHLQNKSGKQKKILTALLQNVCIIW